MRTLLFLFISCITCTALQAQQINGVTQDDQGKPLAGSSITLKKTKDSSIVKLAVSDASGKYEFKDISTGLYFINISHVGYTSRNTPVFEVSGEGITNAPVSGLTGLASE